MSEICLRGIAWNHSRALPPLVATAQRYEELNPGVRIVWEKRTLHEFGHASLAQLAARYDLLVIDHPMMGEAAAALVDLNIWLGQTQARRLRKLYVGQSFQSYNYEGGLYALPIDAAAPAASFRPDLLDQVPNEWDDLLNLARLGKVCMPGFPADLFLNWMALCVSRGGDCATDQEHLFGRDEALASLEDLRALASSMPPAIYEWNPIALYEAMASSNEFAYCPFAYTYSNYSRRGFAPNLLQFAQPVNLSEGDPLRTVLGGTGIAVSKMCATPHEAVSYSIFVADPAAQRDLYGPAGGQPAARAAWDDPLLGRLSGDFFAKTRASIESAYVRPRYRGYVPLQEHAGGFIVRYLKSEMPSSAVLESVDALYRESLRGQSEKSPLGEVQSFV
jgi:multiple sugar transport system substrate-binding protein